MIDAHIHLQHAAFAADLSVLLKRAHDAGVRRFFCAATSAADWEKVLEIARRHPEAVPFLGTHPEYADTYDAEAFLRILTLHPDAKTGEIGLDNRYRSAKEESAFISQLEIAAALKRPCVIHCVKSFHRLCPILKNRPLPPALLFHSFSASINEVGFLAAHGGYFSFSGSATRPDRAKARDLIKAVPLNRIVVETDAPDMLPDDECRTVLTEKRNLPENLPLILRRIAAIKEIDEIDFCKITTQNALRFEKGEP